MKKWSRSFTYKPKVEKVLNFECTQTIREKYRTSPGDQILFHGWVGVPYYSKWTWRMRVEVSRVIPIQIYDDGILFHEDYDLYDPVFHEWEDLEYLAYQDGIQLQVDSGVTNKGEQLGLILKDYHGKEFDGEWYEIIFWEFPPLQRRIPKEIEVDFFDRYDNTSIVYYHMRRKKLINKLGGVCEYAGCGKNDYDKLEFHHHDHIERGMERGGGWGHLIQIEKDLENGHDIRLLCHYHHEKVDKKLSVLLKDGKSPDEIKWEELGDE